VFGGLAWDFRLNLGNKLELHAAIEDSLLTELERFNQDIATWSVVFYDRHVGDAMR
jgi:hypothetical protein